MEPRPPAMVAAPRSIARPGARWPRPCRRRGAMAKNIIFCADGTWNGPGQDEDHDRVADPTNVFKVFANLDGVDAPETTRLADEQERRLATPDGTVQQVAKYLHGVGDSGN